MRANAERESSTSPSLTRSLSTGAILFLWQVVRLPVVALLSVLEPVVRVVLSAGALLSVLVAFVLKFSGAAPHFPFWGMIGFAAACAVTLSLYYLIIRLLSFTPRA